MIIHGVSEKGVISITTYTTDKKEKRKKMSQKLPRQAL